MARSTTRFAMAAVLLASLGACDIRPVECVYICEQTGACPFGLTCGTDKHCHSDGDLNHCPAPIRRAFVSSAPFDAKSGRDAADAQCNAEGTQAWHAGSYRALLSTTKESALTHVGGVPWGWIRADGSAWVQSKAELTGDLFTLPSALNLDVSGGVVSTALYAWTGSRSPDSVARDGEDNCGDWSAPNKSSNVGRPYATDSDFFNNSNMQSCSSTDTRLYCVQVQ